MRYIPEESGVIIYWDLPEGFTDGEMYSVTLNGNTVETEKCHVHFTGLEPETEYIAVWSYKGTREEITVRTLPVRKRVNVLDFGAVGDGVTLNTAALQKAIDSCENGVVYIPEGDYMTGSLFLHSDMELYLEKGAILHGTTEVNDYSPKIKSRFEGKEMMCYSALINIGSLNRDAVTCRNVRICGEGTVYGGGRTLADNVVSVETELMKAELEAIGEGIKEYELPQTIPGRARPRLINISSSENIVISGITVANGPCWNVHMIYSRNIETCGVTFRSSGVWNGDGWDPDSSTDCTIFGCEFYTGDDAVAIKSGKNPEGNVINRPSERIRIFDCKSNYGHGVTIGSEMSGGINDVRIWNCDMSTSVYGVEIKATKKRGGYVRNVHVSNTKACRILLHSVGYNDDGEGAPTAPVFEDCTFENIELTARMHTQENEDVDCEAIEVSGFDIPGHYAKNIKFKNITIGTGDGRKHTVLLSCCDGISFEGIKAK
ncbi:MAG: glycoside hydrolase family 28 protein [Ruminococcaceae bacterium]|nr:glycoside hydrolase family 28 protein [Oscillospiraceae bacterium]